MFFLIGVNIASVADENARDRGTFPLEAVQFLTAAALIALLIWETYAENTRKLNKDVKKLRSMKGFGKAKEFYNGVQLRETFEHDFLPIDGYNELRPFMLVIILDLYFRLTPITMVEETPEIREMAKLMKIKAHSVVEVMDVFQFCDPYLNRDDLMITPLLLPCQDIWNRYGNDNPDRLSALAAQLKDYFQ